MMDDASFLEDEGGRRRRRVQKRLVHVSCVRRDISLGLLVSSPRILMKKRNREDGGDGRGESESCWKGGREGVASSLV